MELTKTLLSDRPEFIWKTEAAGLAPYISKTFPEVFAAWKKQKSCAKQSLEEKVCSKDVPAADKDAIKTETVAQQGHMFVKHECETDMAGEFLLLRHICQQKKPCAGRIFLPRRARELVSGF